MRISNDVINFTEEQKHNVYFFLLEIPIFFCVSSSRMREKEDIKPSLIQKRDMDE